ncbi:MAG TPA: hypothetical protein VGA38_00960 [Candidatus Limnocylindria bacterium]
MGKRDTRWLSGIAGIAGGYVVISELTFKGNSTLTPVLMSLGIGLVALAAAHLFGQDKP